MLCSTKERRPFLRDDWRPHLHEYLGGTVRGLAGVPLKIGGVQDHVHALIGLKPTHCISDFVRELKKATSVWASTHHEPQFEWQEGYSIFAVSVSTMEAVSRYIERQEEHHRKRSFVEELKELLEKHGVQYDPKYLV
jgi:putative transposase